MQVLSILARANSYISRSLDNHSLPKVRIFVDGAHKQGNGAIGRIMVEDARMLLSWSLFIGTCPTSCYAEARAVMEGLLKCKQLGLTYAAIYTDSVKSLDKF